MADFKRVKEVEQLKSYIGKGKVNVVAGLRRSGKTYLLDTVFKKALIDEGLFKEDDFGILYLEGIHKFIRQEHELDETLNKFKEEGKKIIIVDEVQTVTGFSSSIKAFVKANKNISVYVTGSNSKIISYEIINMFQDMANPIFVSPLTYKEIIEEIPDYKLEYYLMYGGLPIVVNLEGEEKVRELMRINNEIVRRDLINNIEDKLTYLSDSHIEEMISLIASSVSPVSPSAIAKRFVSGIARTGADELLVAKEIRDILNLFDNSFLMKHIDVDDYNENIPLENIGLNKKYYFADNGLRYINCQIVNKAMGLCLENGVFLKLDNAGITPHGKLFLGSKNEIASEIDFNYKIKNKEYFIQVTHTINEADYKREITNLKELPSFAEKQIIYLINATGKEETEIKYIKAKDFFTFW